jgi:hypothetical protein
MPPKFDPGCTRALSAGEVYYCRDFFRTSNPVRSVRSVTRNELAA